MPVAVMSGRDLADIRTRISTPEIWYAGSHGFERIAPDGSYHQNDAAAAAVPVLEHAAAELPNAWRTLREYAWSTSASPLRFTIAMSQCSGLVTSRRRYTTSGSATGCGSRAAAK
jgi:hypothetical protein